MSNTPQIRFAGFTDAWEQRKLEEVITVGNGMDYKHLSEGDIPVYGTGGYMLNVDKALSYDKDAIGIGRKGTIDKPYVLKAPFWTVDTLFYCIPKEDYSLDFVYCIFQNVNWKEKDESTGVPSLSKVNINSTDVKVPTLAEQEKIGEYFSKLDSLITLHQRKCDALQKFKKSMLQKMFPQNGESVPEIRFAGFTDAWEQRKVSDVLSESRDAGHSGDIAKKLTVKLWGKGVYAKNDKGSAATQYFTRHAGQFIYSKLDFLNSAFGVVPQELESYESTADLPAFDCIAVDPYFMFYRAIQPSFYLTNGMIADGSRKAKRIHVETFLDMPLDLPSIEEQKKVASYFTQLDSLITLHQRKLETLQKMKKSLLQKMFV